MALKRSHRNSCGDFLSWFDIVGDSSLTSARRLPGKAKGKSAKAAIVFSSVRHSSQGSEKAIRLRRERARSDYSLTAIRGIQRLHKILFANQRLQIIGDTPPKIEPRAMP